MGLVSAPAGFGKSTLVAQWVGDSECPVAWVTLDRDDSDPVRFWLHLIAALDRAIPGAFPALVDRGMSTLDERVSTVSNRLCSLQTRVTVVLDDYHEVRSPEVDESIARLISQLPPLARLVISTRRDPGLAMSRLWAAEQLVEFRQRDLRFNAEEAADWFESRDVEPTPDLVEESLAITEGWPAAFTLIFGSSRRLSGPTSGSDRRHITEYIREEVLRSNEDDWPLLLVAAFCPQVCAPLLEHTLDISDGREALQRLERSEVLFSQVDGTGEWYRLHPLVAEHVLLGRESDVDVRNWMLCAAKWYAANDHARIALDMTVRAGKYSVACDMINRSWLDYLRSGQFATLRRDLTRIPPEVAERSAPLLVTRAWLNARDGRWREAVSDLGRAESFAPDGPLPDGCPSVEASRAVMNALYAMEGLPTVAASARRADTLIDEASPYRPIADYGIGYASFMSGNLTTAQAAFDRVLVSPEPLLRSVATGWSAVIDVLEGRVHAAKARLEEAAAIRPEQSQLASMSATIVARAAVACAEGRPIEAAAELAEVSHTLGSADPTDQLEVLIWLAGAEVSVGRTQRARRWVDDARRLIDLLGGSDWHTGRLVEIEDRMGPEVERTGRDPGLTERETRILQLLSATHLSQREIARELGISFNTIKSHVKSIYVKLGATSREEASQIAGNQGLV